MKAPQLKSPDLQRTYTEFEQLKQLDKEIAETQILNLLSYLESVGVYKIEAIKDFLVDNYITHI